VIIESLPGVEQLKAHKNKYGISEIVLPYHRKVVH